MTLIQPDIWNFELPWENCPEPRICTYMDHNVEITNMIKMYVRKEVQRGWWRDKKWELHECLTDWTGGFLISKEQFGYGHYRMKAKVPGWRGSWPAFWLIDTSKTPKQGGNGMGVPPEVDIMEQMVKNCLSRYSSTCSFHDIPLEQGKYSREVCQTNREVEPLDKHEHIWLLEWEPDRLKYLYDGQVTMEILKSQCTRFPDHPMNILVDLTIGDWGIKNHGEPFVISELDYY